MNNRWLWWGLTALLALLAVGYQLLVTLNYDWWPRWGRATGPVVWLLLLGAGACLARAVQLGRGR